MNAPIFTLKDVWCPDEKYSNHRIPGMIVTKSGTLLIYCEARRDKSDWAMMDIMLQRSVDHGETFSAPILLAEGNEEHPTVNNPVMMQDKNGRIHLLYCEDYTVGGGRALHRYSDDDGVSWSDPIDVTRYTLPETHNAFAFGPGHGICTESGTLIVPVWMVEKRHNAPIRSHLPAVVSTFYSTDDGKSWAVGEILESGKDAISPNETVAALTSDGGVYMNSRHCGFLRLSTYSESGYSGWSEYTLNTDLDDPQCFGSVVAYNDKKAPYSLIFANCRDNSRRARVTVSVSVDNGKSYPVSKLIDSDRGGYVEIAADNEVGLIYLLYENNGGETDHLATFNYEWLTK